MNTLKNRSILAAVIIVASIVVGAFWWRFADDAGTTSTTYERLIQANSEYVKAQQYSVEKDYQSAEDSYRAALQSAKDQEEQGHILSRLAALKDVKGDYAGAIADFKKIASDSGNTASVRAYAVQYMGTMRLKYFDPAIRDSITKEIFKDTPYSTMWVPDDTALSYRHLFEYSSSIYPLALSELMIADWYAMRLSTSPTTPDASSYMSIIETKLESAEKDIAYIEKTPSLPARSLVPFTLTRGATVKGRLATAGLLSPESADDAFKQALQAFVTYGYKPADDSFARYHYAAYLSRAAAPKKIDIQAVLAPFSTDASYASSSAAPYFKAGRTNLQGQKANLQTLAKLDPDFKKFLTSLGWTSSDFVAVAK